jgi:hypothetical protein
MNKFLEVCSLLDWLMMEHGRILLQRAAVAGGYLHQAHYSATDGILFS